MFCGTVLWMLHGINLNDKAIIYANIITSALNAVILSLKISDLLKEKEAKKKAP
jgi:uncharacterized protein with PQ loop repeat